ncbi:pantoate--beta-alanine ligase [Streptomyces diacarni]|uniref:Pantothenate synthetase n=1 Tax=Streptomyces diacarni TaxID=2800381 RepID=A0A367F151_9ACTN|nr:pantoate--beta-alanine ligase [Streptomyces diacarni]RCG23525.1 pantoate--beta-alanine ligase [Streptomyces diacarni]
MTAHVVTTAAELRGLRGDTGAERAVVMTMGALHEGHAALVRAARERVGPGGQVVVTVFVNPLQFGAGEDLDRYPRTLEADVLIAGKEGADVVFAPPVEEVYPGGEPQVRVSAGPMGDVLEGASRPGHFDGMLTVVAKLLHLTAPDVAFFGQKDAQQLALVRRMAGDLNFRTAIVAVPTVREDDGLALSSRNRYLGEPERTHALALSRALRAGEQAAGAGPAAVLRAARDVLAGQGRPVEDPDRSDDPDGSDGLDVDYVALVDPASFREITDAAWQGEALLAVAARAGRTRLIDNVPLHLGAPR